MKILIIEDEAELAKSISDYLSEESYSCEIASTFKDALEKAEMYEYDCILLDLMLPGMEGLEILRRLRAERVDSHVLILTAKDRVDQRVTGLTAGADDYLVKPFEFRELMARLRVLLLPSSPPW